jgi:hypothetical protein
MSVDHITAPSSRVGKRLLGTFLSLPTNCTLNTGQNFGTACGLLTFVCSTAALFIFGSKKSCVSPVFISSPLRPSRLSKRFLEGKSCNGQGCRLCETNFDMPRTAPESTTRGFLRHGGSPSRHGCQYSNGLTSLTLKVLQ